MLILYCSFALSFTHGRRLPSRLVNARDTLVTCTKNVKKWKNFSLSIKEAGEVKEQNSIHVSCSLTHLPVNGNELARRKYPTKEKKTKTNTNVSRIFTTFSTFSPDTFSSASRRAVYCSSVFVCDDLGLVGSDLWVDDLGLLGSDL
jgi:hypothetical protein